MCLGVPGQIIEITEQDDVLRLGRVSFAGVIKGINLSYVPEADSGDWVMVHAGFAIAKVDEAAAQATLDLLRSTP